MSESPGKDAPSGVMTTGLGVFRPASGLGVPLAAAAALLALTLLVALGWTQALDERVRDLFRPNDEWGAMQWRADVIMEAVTPSRCLAVLVLVMTAAALARRSWRPFLGVVPVVAAAGALTIGLKVLVGRPDTHERAAPLGGSYPSGHVVTVLVVAGCVGLLCRARPGAWIRLVVVGAGTVMSWALLVQTVHWATDILAGVLIAVLVLSLARRLPLTHGAGGVPAKTLPASWP